MNYIHYALLLLNNLTFQNEIIKLKEIKVLCIYQNTYKINNEIRWKKRKTIRLDSLTGYIRGSWADHNESYNSIHLIDNKNDRILYPIFIIDIDSNNLEDARETLNTLMELFSEEEQQKDIQCYFSGSKGFHLYINSKLFINEEPTEENFGPNIQKKIAQMINNSLLKDKRAKIDTIALGTNRIIRSANSINYKSNLYKIPLDMKEIGLEISKIKDLAKNPRLHYCTNIDIMHIKNKSNLKINLNLSKFYSKAKEESCSEIIEKSKQQIKTQNHSKNHSKNHLRKKIRQKYEPLIVEEKCKALRNLKYQCFENKTITPFQRYVITTSFFETINQEEYLKSFFRLFPNYNDEITTKKIREKQLCSNCDLLFNEKFCSHKCSRYIIQDMGKTKIPTYFGSVSKSPWFQITNPDAISQYAFQLKKYHETTSDLFDWNNCNQFLKNHSAYSSIISDNLRIGRLPALNNYVGSVSKGGGKNRTLTFCSFEIELMTAIIIPLIQIENHQKKIKNSRNGNIFSFGYLSKPECTKTLITPWIEEYINFKNVLKYYSESEEYSQIYTDDIVNYYPSITKEIINEKINSFKFDDRAKDILCKYYNDSNYIKITDNSSISFEGLSQGPIISHFIAASILLDLDTLFSITFDPEEAVLVRYADDIHIFFNTSETKEKIENIFLKKVAEKLQIEFHGFQNESEKSICLSTREYRKKLLFNDLHKYEIQYNVELSRISEKDKENFIKLLIIIFDNSYEKILSSDPSIGLKSLEKELTSLIWKTKSILKHNQEMTKNIMLLKDVILNILKSKEISWKFQTNILMLYIALYEATENEQFIIDLCNQNILDTNSNLYINLTLQLSKLICTSNKTNVINEFSKYLLKYKNTSINFYYKNLEDSLKIYINQYHIIYIDSWLFHAKNSKKFSIGYFSQKIIQLITPKLNFNQAEEFLLKAESEFSFYKKIIIIYFLKNIDNFNEDQKYSFLLISIKFNISEIYNKIFSSKEFSNILQKLPKIYQKFYFLNSNLIIKKILKLIKFKESQTYDIIKITESTFEIKIQKQYILIEWDILNSNDDKIKIERYINKIKKVLGLNIYFEIKENNIYIINILDLINMKNSKEYLDESNRILTILEAEKSFYEDNINISTQMSNIIIPAKVLRINNKKIFCSKILPILKSTLKKTYTYKNGDIKYLSNDYKYKHLPGLRITEYTQINTTFDRMIYENKIYEKMIRYIDPSFDYAVFNKSNKKIIEILTYTIDFIKNFYNNLGFDGDDITRKYLIGFNLLKMMKKFEPIDKFRGEANYQCLFYMELIDKIKELLKIDITNKNKLDQTTILDLAKLDSNLKFLNKFKRSSTYDVIFSILLMNVIQNVHNNFNISKNYEPIFPILCLINQFLFVAALQDQRKNFSYKNKTSEKLDKYINDIFNPSLQKTLNKNFIYPTLSNYKSIEHLINVFGKINIMSLTKMKPQRKIQTLYVNKIIFSPNDLSDDFLKNNFEDISFSVYTDERGLNGFFKYVVNKHLIKDRYCINGKFNNSGSLIKDWSFNRIESIKSNSFISFTKNQEKKLTYASNSNQIISPINFCKSKIFNPSYKINIIIVCFSIILFSILGFVKPIFIEKLIIFSQTKIERMIKNIDLQKSKPDETNPEIKEDSVPIDDNTLKIYSIPNRNILD